MSLPKFEVVVLMKKARNRREFHAPLKAAAREIEDLFNSRGRETAVFKLRLLVLPDRSESYRAWKSAEGELLGTYDSRAVAELVRALSGTKSGRVQQMIVIDQELTPPEGWRYLLGQELESGAVISTAALDPGYWSLEVLDRVAPVKHRVRSLLIIAIGRALGVETCQHQRCFFFQGFEVSSVRQLDYRVELGPGHSQFDRQLVGWGYAPDAENPEKTQPLVRHPGWASGGYEYG